jgi:uncharacterized membrane protein
MGNDPTKVCLQGSPAPLRPPQLFLHERTLELNYYHDGVLLCTNSILEKQMPFILQAVLVLAILGFCFYLLNKHALIASPFREIIYFIVLIGCIFWLLEGFGVIHTHAFRWR